MNEPRRPVGLTVMAILSLFGGLAVLSGAVLIGAVMRARVDPSILPEGIDPQIMERLQTLPDWFLRVALVSFLLKTVLLITSGLGYLGERKIWGRYVGSAYGVVSISESMLIVFGLGAGFQTSGIIGLIPPTLVLILVNGMFKNDLVK